MHSQRILHTRCLSWPDHGVPETSDALDLALRVLDLRKTSDAVSQIIEQAKTNEVPMVVHCSAGVGRTGTILTLIECLKCLEGDAKLKDINSSDHATSSLPRKPLINPLREKPITHTLGYNKKWLQSFL